MVSERVRNHLAQIAGQIPDGDEGSDEPLLAAWDSVRIGLDDAIELCASIELSDWIAGLLEQHGAEKAEQMVRNFVRLLAVPATVETLQMMERSSETVPPL
jgi:hypothetical protein